MPSFSTMPPVVDSVAAACRGVFAGTRVILAYAYGSRIRGDAVSESDLDIGYYIVGHPTAGPLPLADEMVLDEMVLADRLSRCTGVDEEIARSLARREATNRTAPRNAATELCRHRHLRNLWIPAS